MSESFTIEDLLIICCYSKEITYKGGESVKRFSKCDENKLIMLFTYFDRNSRSKEIRFIWISPGTGSIPGTPIIYSTTLSLVRGHRVPSHPLLSESEVLC